MASDWINGDDISQWPLRRLGDLAKVKGGKRMPAGTTLISQKTGHPYLRIVDFASETINPSSLLFVPNEVFPRIARYTISSDDVYISIVGTIGIVGMIPKSLDGSNLTENAAKICDMSTELLPQFLAAYLQSPFGQDQIAAFTVGSTQPKLALFRIADMVIPWVTIYLTNHPIEPIVVLRGLVRCSFPKHSKKQSSTSPTKIPASRPSLKCGGLTG